MASEGYHEPLSKLDGAVVDRHRMIVSIMEELEAVDWYDQRVAATDDGELAAVLAHNRDEEKEHAAMGIEWLRRNDPKFDEELRNYLFTEGPITEVEEESMGRGSGDGGDEPEPEAPAAAEGPHSLTIGSLKHLADTPHHTEALHYVERYPL
ncbi:MAG: ferritin-like domain-containing protein [Microthrixaceae bacterium]